MRKVSRNFEAFLLIVLLVLPASGLLAQGTTATVQGTFLSYDGLPIAGITVAFVGDDGEVKAQAITNKDGKYSVEKLPVAFGARFKISYRVGKKEVYSESSFNPSTIDINVHDVDLQKIAKQQGAKITEEEAAKFRKDVEVSGRQDAMEKHFRTAMDFMEAEDYAMAITEFEAAGDLDDSQPAIYGNLGRAYDLVGQKEDAVKAYVRAIELDPTQAAFYNSLGNVYLALKQVDEAADAFRKAADADTTNAAMFLFNLGVTYYNHGRLAEAIDPFRRVTELDPKNAGAFYFLGVCLLNQADWVNMVPKPGTREAFEAYLKLDPNGQWASEAKDSIQAIAAMTTK